jgi:hypothetical protein
MSDERIRVEVVRRGGFGGLTRSSRVDTDDLDPEGTATLRRLVAEATRARRAPGPPREPSRGADQFEYQVTIDRGDDRRSFVVGEAQLSGADERLVNWVLEAGQDAG